MISAPGSDPSAIGRVRSTPAAGFTLLELVVVVALIGMLAGLSVGTYRSVARQNLLATAASGVSSTIRAARNSAVSTGLPSRVFLDSERNRVSAFGYELVAAWSFEDLQELEPGAFLESGEVTRGAFREPAEPTRRVVAGDGRIGRAVGFPEEGGSLVAPGRSRYQSPQGFSVEAWVNFLRRPLEEGEGVGGAWVDPRRTETYSVLSLTGSWEFGLLGDGSLYGVIGDPEDRQAFIAATASAAVLDGRWTHIRASFDGLSLLLEVDGVALPWRPFDFERVDERDWPPLPTEVPSGGGDLVISHPARIFVGWIDEVKVRVAREPLVFPLPPEVVLLGDSRVIEFDSRGALDPVRHSSPQLVRLGELGPREAGAPEVAPAGRGTQVDPSTAEAESAGDDGTAEEPESMGDPIEALARYFEDFAAQGELDRSEDEASFGISPGEAEASEAEAARSIRRVHRIIIDLTGTIRG